MESPLSFFRMHWDHEPLAVPRRTESADKSDALQTLRAVRRCPTAAKRLECVRLQRRFPKADCDSVARKVHGESMAILRSSRSSELRRNLWTPGSCFEYSTRCNCPREEVRRVSSHFRL